MATSLPITNGFYVSDVLPLSHQECTNFFVRQAQTPALVKEYLVGTPGIDEKTTTGTEQQVNRGSLVKNGIPYYVNGTSLYTVTMASTVVNGVKVETFTATPLGTVEGTGRVPMATNGTQLMILVPGGAGYIYDENAGTPFQEITDGDFTANGNPQIVVFVDGYFLCTTDSKKFIVSALNDGTAWNALDFGTAESDPDAVVAPIVVRNQVFIAGTITTEGFQNLGGSGFPFQRNNVFLDKGCAAPFSIVNSSQSFYMIGLGEDEAPAIWRFTGNNFQRVSTTPIDVLLGQATEEELSQAFGFSYAERGSFFVGWTFGNKTVVFEQGTQKWHERKSYSESSLLQERWRVNSIVTAYGRLMVGDSLDGRIGELSSDMYTEYGNNISRIVATQPLHAMGDEVRLPILELTMESGVGNADVPNPKVGMSTSKDGKLFGYERIRPIGKKGAYNTRVFWRKNGRFPRTAVLRFSLTDPVKPVILKLETA